MKEICEEEIKYDYLIVSTALGLSESKQGEYIICFINILINKQIKLFR